MGSHDQPGNQPTPDGTAAPPWPPISFDTHTWRPSTEGVWDPRRGTTATQVSYETARPPLIAGRWPVISTEASEASRSAEQALTRFDAELGSRVSAFGPVLLRSEAASSSQIENLTASARSIFSAELGAATGTNAQKVAAHTRAMRMAIDLSEEITPLTILRMHAALMQDDPRHAAGAWREEAVWIGTRSDSPRGATFVAPHHELVPALITDLTEFAADTRVPALVSVAVTHAQFETVHPFTDGNGRTGRALAQSMLRNRGITRATAVPVSAGLLADVAGYHNALSSYRRGDLDPIVLAFSRAALRAVANARTLVEEIDAIRASWETRLHARRDSNAWRLLDILVRQPVLTSASAATALGVRQPNAYPPLRALADAGIVQSRNEHRMGPFWRSDEILAAVDDFARRAGRREAV